MAWTGLRAERVRGGAVWFGGGVGLWVLTLAAGAVEAHGRIRGQVDRAGASLCVAV